MLASLMGAIALARIAELMYKRKMWNMLALYYMLHVLLMCAIAYDILLTFHYKFVPFTFPFHVLNG